MIGLASWDLFTVIPTINNYKEIYDESECKKLKEKVTEVPNQSLDELHCMKNQINKEEWKNANLVNWKYNATEIRKIVFNKAAMDMRRHLTNKPLEEKPQ